VRTLGRQVKQTGILPQAPSATAYAEIRSRYVPASRTRKCRLVSGAP
jgi:hypothetical protein